MAECCPRAQRHPAQSEPACMHASLEERLFETPLFIHVLDSVLWHATAHLQELGLPVQKLFPVQAVTDARRYRS